MSRSPEPGTSPRPVMVTILAFSVAQRSLVLWPSSSADCSAVRLTFGSGALTTVTVTVALSRAVFLPRLATISYLVVSVGVTLLPPILSTFWPLSEISLAFLVSHFTVTASPAVTSFRETVSLAVGDAQAPNRTAIKTITRPEIECLILRVIYPPFLFGCEVYQDEKRFHPLSGPRRRAPAAARQLARFAAVDVHRPDLPSAAAVRLKRDVTAVRRPGRVFVPAFARQLQGLPGCHVGDVDVEGPVAVPGERQEAAVGRPRGRIHMPAHAQQLAFVRPVRADHVNPRRSAAVRNEGDLAPGLRIPSRRNIHRVASARQPLRVRSVSVRDVNLHRTAVLARSESDPPVGADRGRSRGPFEPRRTDDQTVLASNDDVRVAVAVRDVGQPLAVGRERRKERDRAVAREGLCAKAVVIHLVDFAVGDVGDLRLGDAFLPGQKPDDLVGELVGHLARLAAHRGGEHLLLRFDVVKEALRGVRAG